MRRPLNTAIVMLLMLVPLSASAQMTLISEERFLEAYTDLIDENTGDNFGWGEFASADGLGPFGNDFFVSPTEFFGYTDAEAIHNSTLSATELYVDSFVYTDAELFEGGYAAAAYAASHFEVTFSIAANQNWSLIGDLEASANGSVDVSLFDGIGNTIYSDSWFEAGPSLQVTESGALTPDTYTLVITATSFEDIFDPDFYVASVALFNLTFAVSGGTSSVGDNLALGRYLTAGPNPMQSNTTIAFAGAANQGVELDVYDLRGRLVRSLMTSGSSSGQVAWDGRNSSGQNVPQGIYFVRMRDGQDHLQRKVTVIR